MADHGLVECPERAQRVEGLMAGHSQVECRLPPRKVFPPTPRRWHRRRMVWVYILRCADGSLYVGHTQDLQARERAHNEGRGGRYTARHGPVVLVYTEACGSVEAAVAREQQLKRWRRAKKEALIAGDIAALKRL